MTDPRPVIALKRYESSPDSLRELIELCGGFDRLKPDHRVLVKPNLMALDKSYPMPLYGVFTTTRLVHDMVLLLKEFGVKDITIGEGSTRSKHLGVPTTHIFQVLGYPLLTERYGVKLVDLFEGPFQDVDLGEFSLEVSRPILENDFLINVPVLKTHNQAVLSLGMKNLKGSLSFKSRKFCHGRGRSLDHHLSFFLEKIRPALTVLDGIYGLERGPFYQGKAVVMKALAASRNPIAVEVAGAELAGMAPESIPHIKEYADRHGFSLNLGNYELRGTPIQELRRPLKWDNNWREDNTGPRAWDRLGIFGISLPKYDQSLCTGCSGLYGPLLTVLMASYTGPPSQEIEILTGKTMKPSGKAAKTVLFGNCMIKENRKDPSIKESVLLKGCPPSLESVFDSLAQCGIQVREDVYADFRQTLVDRYKDKEGFDESLFYLAGKP